MHAHAHPYVPPSVNISYIPPKKEEHNLISDNQKFQVELSSTSPDFARSVPKKLRVHVQFIREWLMHNMAMLHTSPR